MEKFWLVEKILPNHLIKSDGRGAFALIDPANNRVLAEAVGTPFAAIPELVATVIDQEIK